jgi:DNA-binding transcriptional MerR regulator
LRISQLAAATGVSVATIKYYLREQLLHDGVLTSATQARYDDSHVRRLNLIRALMGPAGLSVSATRQVLLGLDNPPESGHDLLGIAHHALTRPVPDDIDLSDSGKLLEGWGWGPQTCDQRTRAALVEALNGLSNAGFEPPAALLDRYAAAMRDVAKADVESVPTGSTEAAIQHVVLGTVLMEPVLLAMRRLAQEKASLERFGGGSSELRGSAPSNTPPG